MTKLLMVVGFVGTPVSAIMTSVTSEWYIAISPFLFAAVALFGVWLWYKDVTAEDAY